MSIQSQYPTTVELLTAQRLRRNLMLWGALLFSLLVFGSMYALLRLVPHVSAGTLVAVGILIIAAVTLPVLIWNEPRRGLYILFCGAMLFPGISGPGTPGVPTSTIPFWWNLSTAGQIFAHTDAFKPLSFSCAELIMVITALSWFIRSVSKRDFHFERGAFFGAIAVYIAVVAVGFVHGLSRGGDLTMALYEVRAQAHFFLAYLLAANLVTDRKQVLPLLWLTILCMGLQSLFGTVSYVSKGGNVGDQGVLPHDDSLLLNLVFFTVFITWIGQVDRRLFWGTLLLTPIALIADLANNRRAGIAAFIVAFIPLLPLLYSLFKAQRPRIVRFGICFAFVTAIYLPLAWNSNGVWAMPAHAIRSQSDADERDASSDYYRLQETEDLKFTRDTSPYFGIGYGQPFYQIYQLPSLSTDFLYYLPHNSVMWVWMRLGHIGFFCFMMMFATILIKGTQSLKEVGDPLLKLIGLLALLDLLMMFTYGKYDIQFINSRQMFALGTLVGVLAVAGKLDRKQSVGDAEVETIETVFSGQ